MTDILSLQTHPVDSTLKRRGHGRFHVVSTWNPCGVFVGYYIRGNIIVKRQFTLPKEETDQLWIDQLFILVREFLGGNDKLIRNNH